MFRHVVQMTWKHELSSDEAAAVRKALDDLGSQSPTVRAISHGPDAGVREGGASYALVADFDDPDGWKAYSAHPAHDVVRTVMGPIVASQSVVQFWVGPESEAN
jgi:hypothetical protein